MQRILTLVACAGALFLGACTGDSNLPNPTGKGQIRAINAMPGSPEVRFLIEERPLGSVLYKSSSAVNAYDDFDYNFNFEALFPGESSLTRVATYPFKVEKDKEHIFVLTGEVTAPSVSVWTGDIRVFSGTETSFEARFAHTMTTLGSVDVHFNPVGEPPAAGMQAATLAFGEITTAALFEQGDYVVTITAAGDLGTVYFQSGTENFAALSTHVISTFDSDRNDTAPVAVRAINSAGGVRVIADADFPPTIRFINSSADLGTVDVYEDELLTSQVFANLAFGDASPDIETDGSVKTYYYTPAGSTAQVLFENTLTVRTPGSHTHIVVAGTTDNYVGAVFQPDRASFTSSAKLRLFHGASNVALYDIYLTDRDVAIGEDDVPIQQNAPFSFSSQAFQLAPGSYDLYLTVPDETTELAGPFAIDVALGDVIDLIALDTVDPNVIEIRDIPIP